MLMLYVQHIYWAESCAGLNTAGLNPAWAEFCGAESYGLNTAGLNPAGLNHHLIIDIVYPRL